MEVTNLVTIIGRLARPAEQRELKSGAHLVAYEITIRREGEKAETVPVVWFGAPASAAHHDVDEEVVVVGRVRRRFFKRGDHTESRTEVVADTVLPARQVKRVRSALKAAEAQLTEAIP